MSARLLLLHERIASHAKEQPDHPALRMGDETVSYAALDLTIDRVAVALQERGLAKGDVIAICALNSIAYVVAFLGALRAGVVVAPLAPSATADALGSMIRDCGARILFVDHDAATALANVAAGVPRVMLDDRGPETAFSDWLGAAGVKPDPVAVTADDAFNIIYSSGTTGHPKGIVQPHAMRAQHIVRGQAIGYAADAVTILSTPLYSNTTLVSFVPALAYGGTIVLMAKFDPRQFLELAQRHHATHAMLVPVQFQRLMDRPDFGDFDLSAFRMKTCTSAPFPAALKAQVLERWPGGLIEFYGMTEGGGTLTLAAHLFPDKLHTVGRPAEGHDIRLIDDAGCEVPVGEVGELVGHSPAMMTGYHDQPGKTREAEWFDAGGRRFIRTGDIGRFDAEGFLSLIDRKKDLIISGGFNIYPSDLESILLGHAAVEEAAVIGVPSLAWGETPVAFVKRRAGFAQTEAELRDWFSHHVGKTQRLTDLRFIDALPRNAIGKILKRELRDIYLASETE